MVASFKKIFFFGVLCIFMSATVVFKLFGSIQYDPNSPLAMMLNDRTCNYVNIDDPACLSGRLAQYCAAQNPTGVEGKLSGIQNDFILQHVVLNVRHGDRSAIHSINGAIPLRIDSTYVGRKDRADLKIIDGLNSIRAVKLKPLSEQSLSAERVVGRAEKSPLVTILSTPDRHLSPGQLTSHGFYQLLLLGEHLRRAYASLLRLSAWEGKTRSPLRVRSTNYNRTIQSAAALITSLYPWSSSASPLTIHFHPDEHQEVMLGSLLKHRQQLAQAKEIATPGETCGRAHHLSLQMKESGYPTLSKETFQEISEIFGYENVEKFKTVQYVTDFVDAVLPRFCHAEHFQCGESGKCITQQLAERLMDEADKAFCVTYTSDAGGFDYTMLDIHPFMEEIKTALLDAARWNDKSKSAQADQRHKIDVFVGHDTVIAPVLTALGVYSHPDFCKWPELASRVSFELWSHSKTNKPYVRVVYNGRDVTSFIPTCQSAESVRVPIADRHFKEYHSLCPLNLFVDQIDGMLLPHDSHHQACADSTWSSAAKQPAP